MQDSVVLSRNLTENAGETPAPPSKIQGEDHMETDNKLEYLAKGTTKGCHNQEGSSVSRCPISSNEKTSMDISEVIVCSNIEEPEQEGLLCSNGMVDSCGVVVEDGKFFPTVDENKVETDRSVDTESTTVLCSNGSLPDGNSLIRAGQVPPTGDHSGKNIDDLNGVSFLAEASKGKRNLNIHTDNPSCDKEGSTVDQLGVLSGCMAEHKPSSMMSNIENEECGSFVDSNDNKLIMKEDNYSFVSHPDKQVNTAERYVIDVSACVLEETGQQKDDKSSLDSLACDKNSEVESQMLNDLKLSVDDSKISELQSVSSNTVGFTASNNHAVQKVAASDIEKEKSLAFCSLFPVTNARASWAEDQNTKVYQSTLEVNDLQRSASALFSSTNVPEASTKEYTMQSNFNNSLNESKFDGLENSRHHDLNVVFSNSHVDLGANLNCTTFQLGMEETYGVQGNLQKRLETDKHGEAGIDLSDSSFKGKTGDFGSNFNTVFHSQLWNEHKLENVMQGGSADNSASVAQSSNCFQTYDVLSDKVPGLFGENEKYDGNTGFDGLRSDRSGPVEYSFMGTQSSNSLQEEPRVLPYDVDIEQGFDSSFWLGKDDLMPNLAGRNQVTMVCVWCRNVFCQEPNQLGAEAGSIGTICPTCSGRISGQFSFM